MGGSWEAHGELLGLMRGGSWRAFCCYLLYFEQLLILQKGGLMAITRGRAHGRLMGGSWCTLGLMVDKNAHKAEQASKTSAQPPKQRFQNFYVSRQLVQLHRGGCVFTAMWPYCVPTVKLR